MPVKWGAPGDGGEVLCRLGMSGRRVLLAGGVVATVSGVGLVVGSGLLPASAGYTAHQQHLGLAHHAVVAPVAPATVPTSLNCGRQPNLDNPTNSTNAALTSYFFTVTHNGVKTNYCRLASHVSAGDAISVDFTPVSASNPPEVSLAVYSAPGVDPDQQLLSSCASNVATSVCGSAVVGNELVITAPQCGVQVDFIYGTVITNLTQGTYRAENRLIDGRTGSLSLGGCPAAPTPTPTPTTTPTPSPSPGAQVQAASVSTPGTGTLSWLQIDGVALALFGVVMVGISRDRPKP